MIQAASFGRITSFKGKGNAPLVFVLFAAHTLSVYLCAVRLSPWLVGRWFAWIVPVIHVSPGAAAGSWYLWHLEWITIVPALAAGYVATRTISQVSAIWAWSIPAIVLSYKLLVFPASYSVLSGTLMSPLRYYFDIQRVMPNRANFLSIDSARVLAQMTVTAPFYAGVAYSLGASIGRLQRPFAVFKRWVNPVHG
jgi:hypothetical protein